MRPLIALLLVLAAASCTPDSNSEPAGDELHLATASLGGAFYPVGQGMSNLVTKHAEGLTMLPVVSAGAIQNPRLVHAGEVDFGITNANMAWLAVHAEGPYSEPLELSAVGTIHPSILHMVALDGSGIERFEDLKGRRVAVGPAGGGTYAFVTRLLDVHGMSLDDITASYLSYTDGFAQLGDRNVDAAFALAGFPTAAVMQAKAGNDLSMIELAPARLETFLEKFPYYTSRKLAKDVYGLERDVTVVGVNNLVVVNTQMSEERVFAVTRAIYSNLDEFAANNAVAKQIVVSDSLSLPIALHPGAKRFFDTTGGENSQ